MAKLTEQEVFAPFIGKPLNDGYAELPWHDFVGTHILHNYEWMYNADHREQFGLTDKLYADWLSKGIKLDLILSVDDGVVVGGFVEKFRESTIYGRSKLDTYEMTPTQQDLRIVGRILEYITSV